MFPKSEAQRVIAISLGKIATFRSQRGGCSLHKNLLVTNVLQKVRNFVNDDDHTVNWEHRYERTSSSETPLVTAVEDQTVISSFSENPHDKPNEVSSIPCSKRVRVAHSYDGIGLLEPRDAVNGCGMSSNSSSMSDSVFQQENEMCLPNSAFEYYHTIAENEKNSACEAAANSNYSRPESSARARCLKRRQSVEDDSTVCAKRPKFDLDQGVSHMSWRLQPAFSDSDSETEYDNIDSDPDSSASSQGDNTMDAEQICSLVSVFKCSFHGLGLIDGSAAGSCEDLLTSQDYKYQNSPTFIQELTMQTSREGKPHPLRRGMSLPDLCAKQADLLCQKFQQAAPVVALTV